MIYQYHELGNLGNLNSLMIKSATHGYNHCTFYIINDNGPV